MNTLPMQPLSPQEQQRLMGQLYLLLGKQVKSYHKQRHMGDNTSVPVELAQELMASMAYTISHAGGLAAAKNAEALLGLGQELLKEKAQKASATLNLVMATAPSWQTECRWEAISCLRQYLVCYDHLHLAHRGPEELFYPILTPVPEELRGIDLGLFYLNVLWMENQIMAAFDDTTLERLWGRLSVDTLNQCEQVIANGIGKVILCGRCEDLIFEEGERTQLRMLLSDLSPQQLRQTLHGAALRLCRLLELPGNASDYVCAAAAEMSFRLESAVKHDNLAAIFV